MEFPPTQSPSATVNPSRVPTPPIWAEQPPREAPPIWAAQPPREVPPIFQPTAPPAPSIWSDDDNFVRISTSAEIQAPFWVVAAVVFCCIHMCRKKRNGDSDNYTSDNRNGNTRNLNNYNPSNNNTNGNDRGNGNGDEPLCEKIAAMSLEDRKALYQRTFVRKRQTMVLDPSWIIAGNSQKHIVHDTKTTPTATAIGGRDTDIDLALRSTRSAIVVAVLDDDDDNDNDSCILAGPATARHKSSTHHNILHPHYIDPNKNRNNHHDSAVAVVPGTCVICLENLEAGETVVCSENPSCPHLFHRDCMVSFLAHSTQQQETHPRTRKDMGIKNPCPTCRQNFVTVTSSMMMFAEV